MTERELVEYTRKKLAEFASLPAEEQFRRMIERGLINEQGEVLWNLEYAKQVEAEEARRNGAAASPSPEAPPAG